jgi:hypothetical protein
MNELALDVGFASKLNQADIDWLCQGDNLAHVRQVRLGHANIVTPEHKINCNAAPFIPKGWKIEKHSKGGTIIWNPSRVQFYLGSGQSGGVEGNKLRKQRAGKPALNATALDYLLENKHLIPENWKRDDAGNIRYIFFWGTIYRREDGDLYVRSLFWEEHGLEWRSFSLWLDDTWRNHDPAVVTAR